MVIEYNEYGRQGIGVVQPDSGIDYPLVSPSPDIRDLLADFFLSYEDPSTFDGGPEFVHPFKIAWLYGVGTIPDGLVLDAADDTPLMDAADDTYIVDAAATPEGLPTPVHAVDLIVTDANDLVVFDSTEATTFEEYDWGPAYKIYAWADAIQTCRMVVHTKWSPTDEHEPQEYPLHLVPDDGTLDDRTISRLPRRVRSITVALDTFTAAENIDLQAGNNMQLVAGSPTTEQGRRRETPITFDAVPGSGTGKYDDCDTDVGYVARINGVTPDEAGRFLLVATDCYYFRQPTTLISTSPRISVPSISLNPLAGHLKFGNDCGPCCDCDQFVNFAGRMNSLRDAYSEIAHDINAAREQYHANRARWLDSLACRQTRPGRLAMMPQSGPYLDVVGQFDNQSLNCVGPVEMVFQFSAVPTPDADVLIVAGSTRIWETLPPGNHPYTMDGDWPTLRAYWDSVQIISAVKVQFRLEFPHGGLDDETPYAVTGTLTVNVNGVPQGAPETVTVTLNASA